MKFVFGAENVISKKALSKTLFLFLFCFVDIQVIKCEYAVRGEIDTYTQVINCNFYVGKRNNFSGCLYNILVLFYNNISYARDQR